MAGSMNRWNVTILNGAITHWTGSPSVEGGELKGIDESTPGGPPQWAYDPQSKNRERYTFNIDSKIMGANLQEQKDYIADFAIGTRFENAVISGLPAGLDWVVTKANVKHDADGENPSTLSITLSEVGPTTP